MKWITDRWPSIVTCVMTLLVGGLLLIAFSMIPPEDRKDAFVGAIEKGVQIFMLPDLFYILVALVIIVSITVRYLRERERL